MAVLSRVLAAVLCLGVAACGPENYEPEEETRGSAAPDVTPVTTPPPVPVTGSDTTLADTAAAISRP